MDRGGQFVGDRVEQGAAGTGQCLGAIAGLAQVVGAFLDGALEFDPVSLLGLTRLGAFDDPAQLFAHRCGQFHEVGILGLGDSAEELEYAHDDGLDHHTEREDAALGDEVLAGRDEVGGLVLPPRTVHHHPPGDADARSEACGNRGRPHLAEEGVLWTAHPQAA